MSDYYININKIGLRVDLFYLIVYDVPKLKNLQKDMN